MKKRILQAFSLCIVALFVATTTLHAQENLVPNGDLEKWNDSSWDLKPDQWSVGNAYVEKKSGTRDGGTGSYYLMMYARGDGFYLQKDGWRPDVMDVTEGETYTISVWHKTTDANVKFTVQLSYYEDVGEDGDPYDSYIDPQVFDATTSTTTWQETKYTVTIPTGKKIGKAGLTITPAWYSGNVEISFDDISMVKGNGESKPAATLTTPSTFKATSTQQRELYFTWDKSGDEGVSYEVLVINKTTQEAVDTLTTTTPSITVEDLLPNTDYTVQMRAVKGEEFSEWVEASEKTLSYTYEEASESRIPYLYTIGADGSCKRQIKTYYRDLVNPNATITYYIDDVPTEPSNRTLTFPAFEGNYKEYVLKVLIDEGNNRTWELRYRLSVQNF